MRPSSTWRPARSSGTCRACRCTSGPTTLTTTRTQPGAAQIERRLHLLEPLRRRLRTVPFSLDHPFWIEDPDFDLDFHVRHNALPPPGADEQLAELTARIIGRPLDRSRPLWESYVIEGLPDDRFAILTKLHHATIDGASGAELLTMMLDSDPEGDYIDPPATAWHGERVPSDGEMIARASMSLARKPGRAFLLTARTTRELGKATRNPALVDAANQARASLRGPLGALLNVGRPRVSGGRAAGLSAVADRAQDAVQRDDHPPPPLRVPLGPARRGQGHQDLARCDGQRRRHGGVRRRTAQLARPPRRASRRSARRDGPGVDPHWRRDREVDEPRVGDLRVAADRRG